MKDNLLLAGIVGFAGGILLRTFFSFPLPVSLFIILLSAGFFCFWFFARRDWYLFPFVVLLLFALGSARVAVAPNALPGSFVPLLGVKSSLQGIIVEDPDIRETNQRVTVEVREGGETTRILAVAEPYPRLRFGERVTVTGTLEKPKPFDTDGGRTFAYDKFLAKDGVFALVERANITVLGNSSNPFVRVQTFLYDAKHAFVSALELALPEPHASLAEGLIAGGKQGLGKDLLAAFTVAGLLPIVVLSGYNVMIVAEAVLALLSFLPKRSSLVIASIAIALFVVMAGAGASAVRAGLMAGLGLFARASGRTYDALRALLAVFVVMLLINPLLLAYDPGFQFSFAATLGLILASGLFEVHLMAIRIKALREILATTLSAQLFVLPILLYQTGNLSFVAVPANVLVLAVVPFAMGFSALAGLAGLVVPALAAYIALPAYALLSYIIKVAELAAELPFAHVIVPLFPMWLVALLYALVALFVARLSKKAPKPIPQPQIASPR